MFKYRFILYDANEPSAPYPYFRHRLTDEDIQGSKDGVLVILDLLNNITLFCGERNRFESGFTNGNRTED